MLTDSYYAQIYASIMWQGLAGTVTGFKNFINLVLGCKQMAAKTK